ncbi:hypothetical protein [Streptomyces sp. NPDC058861]|uniref:golvesin C-terminal-like domain-containing protein n=1 Tax=Streptomyces sp. NPDC058861 TaxID=3346653 RepID=UPI0036A2A957
MGVATAALLAGTLQATAWADETPQAVPAPAAPIKPSEVPAKDRARVLGEDWKQSTDVAWTTSSDAQGFHLLTAPENAGYAWTTIASLSEPGFDTDSWIGNACVTGSGKRAVVVYAPRTFTNKPELMARGAFAAVVDLTTGHVTKLPVQVSLSYYNPGCGAGESAVLTQSGGEGRAATRLFIVDTVSGKLSAPIQTAGQVTSAVPAKDGSVIAAAGAQIVRVNTHGTKTALANTDTVPYRLTPDSDGGITFLDKDDAPQAKVTRAKHLTAAQINRTDRKKNSASLIAEGPLTDTGLTRSAGTVYLTGKTKRPAGRTLPRTLQQLTDAPKDARVSTRGQAVLTETSWADGQGALVNSGPTEADRDVRVRMKALDSGNTAEFTVDPAERTSSRMQEGRERTPALKGATKSGSPTAKQSLSRTAAGPTTLAATTATGSRTEIVESERVCSVPRNDPRNQAMQPKPRQVEWAVNMAIRGKLNTHISRPANWKNLGMPAYQPQTLFPYPSGLLNGATIPAQVMLGITAQESNMWQASRVAVPGVTASPLIGNYYGIDLYDGDSSNDWDIDWAEADCGYGITQVTDHMRMAGREDGKGGAAWDYQKQRAVALDYTVNVAAGLQILAEKWNQTSSAGLKVNNGNSAKLENWTFALWAYNSGFYADKGDGSPWGLGWTNNPANPEWDAGRTPFMEDSFGGENPSAAAHPQDWPYQEKVLGFAAHPPSYLESPGHMVAAFIAAWWNGGDGNATIEGSAQQNRALAKPPEGLFCDPVGNSCNPAYIGDGAKNETGAGPCLRDVDFRCWWHRSAQWKSDCDYSCGNDFTRFPATWAEEADGTAYPPVCTNTGLPPGARIVDDVPQGTPVIRPGCNNSSWSNVGTFTLDFGEGDGVHPTNGGVNRWPAKVDLHQLGAGFGGHFYFGHTRKDDDKGRRLKITGTWTFNERTPGWTEVFVHLPDHGAHTKQAAYEIETAYGTQTREISQPGNGNRWVSLGTYRFINPPKIRLSTITRDGTGDQDIAFDAMAVVPREPGAGILPEITLPAANPAAPDIDYNDAGIPMNIGDLFASNSRGSLPKCTPVDSEYGDTLCVSRKTSTKTSFTAPRTTSATSIVPWCDTTPGKNINRFEACLWEDITVELFKGATPIGKSMWIARQQIKNYPNEASFNQQIFFDPITMDPTIQALTLNLTSTCMPAAECNTTNINWVGSNTWTVGDKHTANVIFTNQWRKGTLDYSNLTLGWELSFTSPVASKPAFYAWGAWDAGIRCDQRPHGSGFNKGCVFSKYTPTFTVNSQKHPTAAAMYWLLMEKLPNAPGSKAKNKPLHREADKTVKDANRNRICPSSYVPHPTVPNGTCDEYAFASTKESGGGSSSTTGNDCVQLIGPQKPDGTWVLEADPRSIPTWAEKCGRGSITEDHNEGAGSDLGTFYNAQRIRDDDPYFVDTPGFGNCSSIVCEVRF